MATTIKSDVLAGTVQTTTNSTTTIITVPIPTSGVVQIDSAITARIGTITSGASYQLLGTYKNNAGTVTLVGANVAGLVNEDAGLASAAVVHTISGTNVLVQGTGIAATTIEWAAVTYLTINV